MTVQDMAKEVLDNKAAKDLMDDIPDEDEEDPVPPVESSTLAMLNDSTRTLKDALSASTDDTSVMCEHLTALEKFFQKTFVKTMKQTTKGFI